MNSIVYFTKYTEKGPSSRYRSFQYKDILEKEFHIQYYPLFDDDYINNLYANKKINYYQILTSYCSRIFKVLKYLRTDKIVFIEYELLPYFPPILEYLLYKTNVKIILDYDDAIFHNYDLHSKKMVRYLYGNKIPSIVKYANTVITGSPYLSSYLNRFTTKIVEIPTSVNYANYKSKCQFKTSNNSISIGWIGSKSTSINIINIKEVIKKIYGINPKITFKFMGFDSNLKSQLDLPNVEFYNWSVKEELIFLNDIDLGIMPLEDTPFNRGKCGFKLIQYMAMGKPTLSTPLEANVKINRNNSNLFATNKDEWVECINKFISNESFYREVGFRNQKIVEEYYSVEANSISYINIFNQLFNVRN
ncbi:glycosyltransferase family 4 protein [Flavobacterium ammonificans]|uniref:glycosyltransferase family 4 protein n=1 Tax=Flavobacterium ammonificans TaxID=1751056 RepID=UPI001E5785B4|nr:glycosyltransferase family 4 protein [Flavobacterium ammonificans]BDB56768.1 glycosyl transferase [Flavobacterium ammonificans]